VKAKETIQIQNISGRTRYLPYAGVSLMRGCNLAADAVSKPIEIDRLENAVLKHDLQRKFIRIIREDQAVPPTPAVQPDPPKLPKVPVKQTVLPPRVKPSAKTTPEQQAADPELKIKLKDNPQPTEAGIKLHAEREAQAVEQAKAEAAVEQARLDNAPAPVNPIVDERIAQLNMLAADVAEQQIQADLSSDQPLVVATATAVVEQMQATAAPNDVDVSDLPTTHYSRWSRVQITTYAKRLGIDISDLNTRSSILERIRQRLKA